MFSNRSFSTALCGLSLVGGLLLAQGANAAPPPPDTIVRFGVWPQLSNGGIPAVQNNPPNTPFVYTYTIQSGAQLSDTIPLEVCLDSKTPGGVTTWSDQVAADTPSGNLPDVTVAGSPWTFTDTSLVSDGTHESGDQGCQSGSININVPAGTLTTVGNNVYQTNVMFKLENNSAKTGNPPHLDDGTLDTAHIQIQVNVQAPTAPRITCFMTDSEGNLLTDCNGSAITASGSEAGTFAIVANKKNIAVSTNPGQFYYNLLWRNDTGTDQTVAVNMTPNGLSPNGTQAVHWATFPTAGFGGVTPPDFDQVIAANPAGKNGNIPSVLVPAGDTLYVTFHLEWSGTGSAAPQCGACGDQANVLVNVHGEVSGTFANSPDDCDSGALGFNKQ